MLELNIETLTGLNFELKASPSEKIHDVKARIQRMEGIPVSQQHLVWHSIELSDDSLLKDYPIQDGATLKLVLSMRGGPISKQASREDIPLKDISRLLAENTGGHPLTFVLFHNGSHFNLVQLFGDSSATSVFESDISGRNITVDKMQNDSDSSSTPPPDPKEEEKERIREKVNALKKKMAAARVHRAGYKKTDQSGHSFKHNTSTTPVHPSEKTGDTTVDRGGIKQTVGASSLSHEPHRSLMETRHVQSPGVPVKSSHLEYSANKTNEDTFSCGSVECLKVPLGSSPASHVLQQSALRTDPQLNHSSQILCSGLLRKDKAISPLQNSFSFQHPDVSAKDHDVNYLSSSVGTLLPPVDVRRKTYGYASAKRRFRERVDSVEALKSDKGLAEYRRSSNSVMLPTTLKETQRMTLVSGDKERVTSVQCPVSMPTTRKSLTRRCGVCKKKTGLATAFYCRCGRLFCASHRYAEAHGCVHDYKTEGRKLLEKDNPSIRAPKLPKI